MLDSFMAEHNIKMGRDALFTLLASNHLLVRKRKRRIVTTNSYHWLRRYPNLIEDFIPTAINQLWVSDMTRPKKKFTVLVQIIPSFIKSCK